MSDFDQWFVHAATIKQHYKYLLATMDLRDSGLLNHLYSNAVVSEREKEFISCQATLYEQNQELLSVLIRKTKSQFDTFLDALDSTGQHHIRSRISGVLDNPYQ